MLTCYFVRRKLVAWVDGALDEASGRSTARHLERCDRCQADATAYRRLKALIQQRAAVAEPDWTGFWPAIVRGIQDGRQPTYAASRHPRPRRQWAVGAVAAALLVALGLWQWLPGLQRSEAGVVINTAHTEDPRGTVLAYATPEQDVAVVWVLGLEQ